LNEDRRKFSVEQSNQRLDKFLVTCLPDFSRSRLQSLIQNGFVWVDGKVVTKAGTGLNTGQNVEIIIPAPVPVDLQPEEIPLDIIFENDDLLIINKPAGMVVHPAAGHSTGTMVHAVLAHVKNLEGIGGEQRPGVVHRLDKDTSGLIVIAKNDRTLHWLQEQFKSRRVKKTYLALVDGLPPTPQGRIEAPIGRDSVRRKQMAIQTLAKGRDAVTEYRTLERFEKHTLLEVHPLTGRTHQIRLHLAFIGCPIVGDKVYGNRKVSIIVPRQFLHAARLEIIFPGEKVAKKFEANLPDELTKILKELRG
jgi:23S rRNA pseudouridine1911/1915/1917 synthase